MADVVELVIGQEKLTGTAGHGHGFQVGDDGDGRQDHHGQNQGQAQTPRRMVDQPAAVVIGRVGAVSRQRVLARLQRLHDDGRHS